MPISNRYFFSVLNFFVFFSSTVTDISSSRNQPVRILCAWWCPLAAGTHLSFPFSSLRGCSVPFGLIALPWQWTLWRWFVDLFRECKHRSCLWIEPYQALSPGLGDICAITFIHLRSGSCRGQRAKHSQFVEFGSRANRVLLSLHGNCNRSVHSPT